MTNPEFKTLIEALYAIRDAVKELQEPKMFFPPMPEDPDQRKGTCGACGGPLGAHSLRLQCPKEGLDFCSPGCLKIWAAL